MKYEWFTEVVLRNDMPEKGLKKGNVATVVEHHPASDRADGYSPEVLNALGDMIVVLTVPVSEIDPLTATRTA
jgi:hypothetical protein